MIKEIKIENFKSIQSLNLELGRLNIFIGANGSGKSNILESIVAAAVTAIGKFDREFLAVRGFRTTDFELLKNGFNEKSSSNEIIFYFEDSEHGKGEIEIGNKIIFSPSNKIKDIFLKNEKEKLISEIKMRLDKIEKDDVADSVANEIIEILKIKTSEYFSKYLNDERSNFLLTDFKIFSPENNFLRNFDEESQIIPLGVRGEGLFSHIAHFYKEKPELFIKLNDNLQLLDWFQGFEIPKDLIFNERRIKIKDQYLQNGLQYIDQRSANEGFLYLLFYLTLFISDETPKFFCH